MRHFRQGRPALAMLAVLAFAGFAFAIIKALLPLQAILDDSQFIAVAKVEKIDGAPPRVALTIQEDLKGKLPARRLVVDFKGDDEAKKHDHVPQLLKRLATDLPLVLFVDQREKRYTVFAYTNGTWFQFIGQQTGDT